MVAGGRWWLRSNRHKKQRNLIAVNGGWSFHTNTNISQSPLVSFFNTNYFTYYFEVLANS